MRGICDKCNFHPGNPATATRGRPEPGAKLDPALELLSNPDPDFNPVFRPGPTGHSVAITSVRVQIQFQLKFNIIVSENNGINLY